MTKDEIRHLIAERLGYTKYQVGQVYCWQRNNDGAMRGGPPDFVNSLDAMHEAEKWAHEEARRGYTYDMKLCAEVGAYDGPDNQGACNHMRLYHATALQKAQAFVNMLQELSTKDDE